MSAAPAIRFRTAAPADVDAIVALAQSAYRGAASRAGWTTEADFLDGQRTDAREVSEAIARRGSLVLLAERGDESMADSEATRELLASCHIEKQGEFAYFGMFSVRPHLQGAGLGRRVLAEAERIALEELGAREMQMTVIDIRDDLIAWYERRGYRRSGRYKPFPYGNERFGIPRRPDLRFEVLVKRLGPEVAA